MRVRVSAVCIYLSIYLQKVLMFAGPVLACRDSQHLPLPANAYRATPKGLHVFFSGGGTGRRPFQDLAGGAVEGRRRAARRRQELQSIDQERR